MTSMDIMMISMVGKICQQMDSDNQRPNIWVLYGFQQRRSTLNKSDVPTYEALAP